jgi:predicted nucleic acid-binding protein
MLGLSVSTFGAAHAARAAQLAAQLKLQTIGFADFQIAASALVDGADLLTFNRDHFTRVPGLRVLTP